MNGTPRSSDLQQYQERKERKRGISSLSRPQYIFDYPLYPDFGRRARVVSSEERVPTRTAALRSANRGEVIHRALLTPFPPARPVVGRLTLIPTTRRTAVRSLPEL